MPPTPHEIWNSPGPLKKSGTQNDAFQKSAVHKLQVINETEREFLKSGFHLIKKGSDVSE